MTVEVSEILTYQDRQDEREFDQKCTTLSLRVVKMNSSENERASALLSLNGVDVVVIPREKAYPINAAFIDLIMNACPDVSILLPSAKQVTSVSDATDVPMEIQLTVQTGSGRPTNNELSPMRLTLSPREQSVLALIIEGLTNREISAKLSISLGTAKAHVRSILSKLEVDDRTQAAVQAIRRGLV